MNFKPTEEQRAWQARAERLAPGRLLDAQSIHDWRLALAKRRPRLPRGAS